MEETAINNKTDDQVGAYKSTEKTYVKLESALNGSINGTETSMKSTEKKKKAPKAPSETITTTTANVYQDEHVYESENVDSQNKSPTVFSPDDANTIKTKKTRAPKLETTNENNEPIQIEETTTKKKTKAPKIPKTDENTEQVVENSPISTIEPSIEPKPKKKKPKTPKAQVPTLFDSFENLQVTNLDNANSVYPDTNDPMLVFNDDNLPPPPPEDLNSDYTKEMLDSYNNLAASIAFSQYVGDDQWTIIHLPKSARTESKSRIRRILPTNNKDDKSKKKSSAPKGNILKRLRSGMTTLVNDENNLIFGDPARYQEVEYEDEEDDIDTDNLNRYAQKLRELEDQDREVNPEFLVIRDGKTIYGVHEADSDGKINLASRKPIYDRFADQALNEQTEKKKLLSRLKLPFRRNKDKESKSANVTPNIDVNRKSSKNDLTMTSYDNPLID